MKMEKFGEVVSSKQAAIAFEKKVLEQDRFVFEIDRIESVQAILGTSDQYSLNFYGNIVGDKQDAQITERFTVDKALKFVNMQSFTIAPTLGETYWDNDLCDDFQYADILSIYAKFTHKLEWPLTQAVVDEKLFNDFGEEYVRGFRSEVEPSTPRELEGFRDGETVRQELRQRGFIA